MLVAIDVDTERGGALRKEYGVRAYPTFMLVDPAGEIIDVWIGFGSPAEWTGSLDLALADPATVAEKEARFAAAPDLATAEALARHADGTGRSAEAVEYLREAQRLNREDPGSYAYEIFEAMIGGLRADEFSPEQILPAARAAIDYPGREPMESILVAYYMQRVADKAGDKSLLKPFLARAIEETAGSEDPQVVDGRKYILPAYLLHVKQDAAGAVAARKEQLGEGWEEDPGALNSFAWWCFQNGINLDEAMRLALRGAELEQEPHSRANILDTAAAISHASGDAGRAVELMEEAVELNPESEQFKEKLREYRAAAE